MDQFTNRDKSAMILALWAKGFSAKDIHAALGSIIQNQSPSLNFVYAACRRFKAGDLTLDPAVPAATPAAPAIPPAKRQLALTAEPTTKPAAKRPRTPAAEPVPKPEAKLEAKPATKPATKSVTKPETKPAAKSAVKSAAKPIAKPQVEPMELDDDDSKAKPASHAVQLDRVAFCERTLETYKGKSADDIVTCAHTQIKPNSISKQVMYVIVFFSRKEIIYADFTITEAKFDANHYIERGIKPMIAVWKEKHPRLKLDRLVLNHDNSPAYRAEKTRSFLEGAGVPTLLMPARSRDLLPGHFWLVPEIEKSLRYTSVDNLEEAKMAWIHALGRLQPDDFKECFSLWFKRMAIVVEKNGKAY